MEQVRKGERKGKWKVGRIKKQLKQDFHSAPKFQVTQFVAITFGKRGLWLRGSRASNQIVHLFGSRQITSHQQDWFQCLTTLFRLLWGESHQQWGAARGIEKALHRQRVHTSYSGLSSDRSSGDSLQKKTSKPFKINQCPINLNLQLHQMKHLCSILFQRQQRLSFPIVRPHVSFLRWSITLQRQSITEISSCWQNPHNKQ